MAHKVKFVVHGILIKAQANDDGDDEKRFPSILLIRKHSLAIPLLSQTPVYHPIHP